MRARSNREVTMNPVDPQRTEQPVLKRRKLLGAVGTTGALAAAATFIAGRDPSEATAAPKTDSAAAPQTGYQLTEHVQRYYQTTRV
jgi:hypothetical protein